MSRNREGLLKADIHYYWKIHKPGRNSATRLFCFWIVFYALTGAADPFSTGSVKMRSDSCHRISGDSY